MIGKRLIRLLTALIPAKRVRKRVRARWLAHAQAARLARLVPRLRARYAELAAACRAKLARGERLKVAFLVCDASMFSAESVYARMKDDPRFDCFIAVAARVTRGADFLRETLEKTVGQLTAKFGGVRCLYDVQTGRAESLEGQADIVFSSVVYEDQCGPLYTTEALARFALVACLYYGYGGLFKSNERKTPFLPNIVCAWRYFVSNEATRAMSVAQNPLLAANIAAVGYTKMDRLEAVKASVAAEAGRRKKVLVCPHHTIDADAEGLRLSTFLANADLFLRLPKMFPEIDFVFRPHPLLFPRLATAKWWGEARTAAYRAALEAEPNVEFQQGGDYFRSFAESDALVHDCGSFLAEYFYTGKPQCYLLESDRTVEEQFLPFSRRLLEHAYRAYAEAEIVDFLRRVVLAGDDPMREGRAAFARQEVCVNHPDATGGLVEAVINGIEQGEP